jgi:GAF domain-containing protein
MIGRAMPSPWLAVAAETDPLARARLLEKRWERLLAERALGPELPAGATAGLRPTIVESWRRSLATGLDPTQLLAPIEADESEVQERWFEHPLGSLAHVLDAQLRSVADESHSLVVVSDASGLLLHIDGAESLKERAAEMNFVEGARYSDDAAGTNGIGTALAADHALQVFAFEHFNQRHHQWMCSGAPVHDPVSGRALGLIDLSSIWKIAHPRTLELVSTVARTVEQCLLDARRDRDGRLRRRYGDLITRSTDLLVNRDGYVLDGEPSRSKPLDVPEGGGEIVLDGGSIAVAEPLGQGDAYLVRPLASRTAKFAPGDLLQRAEEHLRELATEQAALRQVATLVARESSPDQLFAVVAEQVARVFDVPLVRLVRYEPDGSVVVGTFSKDNRELLPIRSRWPLDSPGVIASVRLAGRPARVDDYTKVPGQIASAVRRAGIRSAVASPIVVGGRLWGAIALLCPRREPLRKDTEARLGDFTELVGTAIANAESREAVGRLAEEQVALRRVATLVARGVSPDELFSAVSNEVGRLFGSGQAAIGRYEPDGSSVVYVGISQGLNMMPVGTRWPLEDFLASTTVYRTGGPARQEQSDYDTASGHVAETLRELNTVSRVGAPIFVEGKLWGVLLVTDTRERLPPDTEERVTKFTELVATAIANAESRAELASSQARAHDLAQEQAALRRVATLVAEGTRADELFSAVTDEVGRLFGAQAAIARFEADGSGMVVVGLTSGIPVVSIGTRWPLEDFLASTAVYRTGRPARSDHTGHHDAAGQVADSLRRMKYVSTVAAPIVVEGGLWGVMTVSEQHEPLPPGTEERVAKFSELVGTAIANAESRAELASSEARAYELAATQAALRRVATLVAEGATADELFATVAQEVAEVIAVPVVGVCRFEADDSFTMVGIAGETSFTVGSRWPVTDDGLAGMILATGRPARKDDYTTMGGPLGAAVREDRMIATVGVPIVVEGARWGFMVGAARSGGVIPDGTEERLARFTQLVATAIANGQARESLAALASEQAALRRVATLVAEGAKAEDVFSAVAEEVEGALEIPVVTICRCERDGFLVICSRGMPGFPAGSRWPWDIPSLPAVIYQTRRAARIDDFTHATGLNAAARDAGVTAAVGVPVVVGGTVWGSICAATTSDEPFAPDTEERLGRFRELVATFISNAIMREELAASRARVIAAADDARRRIERDLHDGAQQQLVTLAVALRRAQAKIPSASAQLRADLSRVADGLASAVDELREISRGIHPAVLTEGGLSPALKALGRRSAVRVKLDVCLDRRLPDRLEVAAYYAVSEALTNASRHANARRVWVSLHVEDDALHLAIRDDGIGGADASRGSGLTGLKDRIEALGGRIDIDSPPRGGTRIDVEIPIRASAHRSDEQSERPPATTTPGPRAMGGAGVLAATRTPAQALVPDLRP